MSLHRRSFLKLAGTTTATGMLGVYSPAIVNREVGQGCEVRGSQAGVIQAGRFIFPVPQMLPYTPVEKVTAAPPAQPLEGSRPARCHPYSGNSILTSSVIFRQRAIWS